eukprot:1154479-Pelagomonas_calceolata.AAC.1
MPLSQVWTTKFNSAQGMRTSANQHPAKHQVKTVLTRRLRSRLHSCRSGLCIGSPGVCSHVSTQAQVTFHTQELKHKGELHAFSYLSVATLSVRWWRVSYRQGPALLLIATKPDNSF